MEINVSSPEDALATGIIRANESSSPEVLDAKIAKIARFAGYAASSLRSHDQDCQHIYVLALEAASHLVGHSALHDNKDYKSPAKYEWAIKEITAAIEGGKDK